MSKVETPSAMMPTDELAAELGVVPKTVLRMTKRGAIPSPAMAATKPFRWKRADIEQWIALDCPAARDFERRCRR